jgi:hypothetical protein
MDPGHLDPLTTSAKNEQLLEDMADCAWVPAKVTLPFDYEIGVPVVNTFATVVASITELREPASDAIVAIRYEHSGPVRAWLAGSRKREADWFEVVDLHLPMTSIPFLHGCVDHIAKDWDHSRASKRSL